jgi:DNA-directed RNA polymerase sigma subunit (sigma70/sigma32)|tara:strand:+ start:206 stop:577 length:372 start_codon:yes stop_codon:yes gene_type:complete
MIDYNGMSVKNPKDYLKIRKILAEPELELGQVFKCEPGYIWEAVEAPDEMKNDINDLLETLTERESKVIKHRFGLDEHKELTLKEVGELFNVSQERVRQIEAKILRKLRHPSRSEILKEWVTT